MNDIEIALEDLDTLVEIARQHTGIASWLGLVPSALIMKEALEKQLNNDWIPCSEKLPTSDGRFEVTIKGAKGKRYVEMCDFHKDAHIHKWGGKYNTQNIIAWRSRPKPYKDVENE